MVEYREHLRGKVAVANNTVITTIPTGLTALVQNYVGKGNYPMNAIIIHEIKIQAPTAFDQAKTFLWSLNTKVETAPTNVGDIGCIAANEWAIGSNVGANMPLLERQQLYPPEMVSSPNLYLCLTTSDTGNVGYDIIYTIRKVARDAFINALLPGQAA